MINSADDKETQSYRNLCDCGNLTEVILKINCCFLSSVTEKDQNAMKRPHRKLQRYQGTVVIINKVNGIFIEPNQHTHTQTKPLSLPCLWPKEKLKSHSGTVSPNPASSNSVSRPFMSPNQLCNYEKHKYRNCVTMMYRENTKRSVVLLFWLSIKC